MPATDGGFSATEPMIDPPTVSTGLEFQGLYHVLAAAIDLAEGCVDVRFGAHQYVSPTYGPRVTRRRHPEEPCS